MVRHPPTRPTHRRLGLAAALTVAGVAGAACAQSASSTASGFSNGYGFSAGELNRGIDVTTRDASGNRIITDGVTRIGSDQSVFASNRTSGAVDAFSGVGAQGGASAIGNSLNVTVQGNYNTVIVNSNQTNNGNISASTVLNGKVNLDGAQ